MLSYFVHCSDGDTSCCITGSRVLSGYHLRRCCLLEEVSTTLTLVEISVIRINNILNSSY